MASGELEPPFPFRGSHARDVRNQGGMTGNLAVFVAAEYLETSNVLRGDGGLIKEAIQLSEALDTIAFLPRQSPAFPANMPAMATPAELLVRT